LRIAVLTQFVYSALGSKGITSADAVAYRVTTHVGVLSSTQSGGSAY